jgi:hypothetical protein
VGVVDRFRGLRLKSDLIYLLFDWCGDRDIEEARELWFGRCWLLIKRRMDTKLLVVKLEAGVDVDDCSFFDR